jgi:anti-sigma regulatory factor (Ser/Thr protein kinase)
MDAAFHQSIANDFPELKVLMDAASEFLENQAVDTRAIFRINLTIEEIVTNIIKFGYDTQGRHNIDVEIKVGAAEVRALISHEGYEFNPVLHERAQPPEELLERETGGLGIYLIKKLLDNMDYRREAGRNIVEVKTPRAQPPPAT